MIRIKLDFAALANKCIRTTAGFGEATNRKAFKNTCKDV
jgi:hypothetical protein